MKRILSLFLAGLTLAAFGAAAEGIGTPEAPVTVTYLCKDVLPDDADTPAVMEAVEKGMAAKGDYVDIVVLEAPAGKYIDVVPLAFRTGEINPDLIYFQGNTDKPVVAEGLLEDLTAYVENSAYVKGLLGGHSVARLKSHPYLLWLAPASVSVPAIRADLLARLSTADALFKDPTVDNYYSFFREIKDSGTAVYAAGGDGGLGRLDSYFNHAFGVVSTLMKLGDSYVYSMVTDQEKAKLQFYAKLYAEGLIDPDYLTMTWDTLEQSVYEGETATICGRAGDVVQVYDIKIQSLFGPEAALVPLPPAKGEGWAYISIDVTKEERGFAINKTADQKVKDACFAILDYMASPEGRMIDVLGAEGTHYTVGADGTVSFTDRWPSYWGRWFPTRNGLPEGLKLEKPVMTEAASKSLALAAQYYADDVNVPLPEELLPLLASVKSVYAEYAADFVRGVRGFGDWDEYVAKFNAVGGDQLSEYFATVLP